MAEEPIRPADDEQSASDVDEFEVAWTEAKLLRGYFLSEFTMAEEIVDALIARYFEVPAEKGPEFVYTVAGRLDLRDKVEAVRQVLRGSGLLGEYLELPQELEALGGFRDDLAHEMMLPTMQLDAMTISRFVEGKVEPGRVTVEQMQFRIGAAQELRDTLIRLLYRIGEG
jgi:hypothetical protein